MVDQSDPATDAGFSQVTLILRDDLIPGIMHHLAEGELTTEERAELYSAFVRATGAGG